MKRVFQRGLFTKRSLGIKKKIFQGIERIYFRISLYRIRLYLPNKYRDSGRYQTIWVLGCRSVLFVETALNLIKDAEEDSL